MVVSIQTVWGKLTNSYLQYFESKIQECATNESKIVADTVKQPLTVPNEVNNAGSRENNTKMKQ